MSFSCGFVEYQQNTTSSELSFEAAHRSWTKTSCLRSINRISLESYISADRYKENKRKAWNSYSVYGITQRVQVQATERLESS